MLLIPAIDLKDGRCVRLKQGNMDNETVFADDPGAMAERWLAQGARRLHLVDLNGAVAGKPRNEAAVRAIVGAVTRRLTPNRRGRWAAQATARSAPALRVRRVG